MQKPQSSRRQLRLSRFVMATRYQHAPYKEVEVGRGIYITSKLLPVAILWSQMAGKELHRKPQLLKRHNQMTTICS